MTPKLFFVLSRRLANLILTLTNTITSCLLRLPSPQACSDYMSAINSLIKLTLSGDVELNPGPTTEELPTQILESQNKMAQDVAVIKTWKSSLDQALAKLDNRLDSVDLTINSLRTETKKLQDYEIKISDLTSSVSQTELKIDNLENRSRCNNFIIYGIPEVANETLHALKEHVTVNIFKAF